MRQSSCAVRGRDPKGPATLTIFGRDGAAADEIQRDQLRRDSAEMAPLLRLLNRTARHTRPETKRQRRTFQSRRTRGQSRTNLALEEWTKEEEWRTDHHSRYSVEAARDRGETRGIGVRR